MADYSDCQKAWECGELTTSEGIGNVVRGQGIWLLAGLLVVMSARTGGGVGGPSTTGLAVVSAARTKSEYLGAVICHEKATF